MFRGDDLCQNPLQYRSKSQALRWWPVTSHFLTLQPVPTRSLPMWSPRPQKWLLLVPVLFWPPGMLLPAWLLPILLRLLIQRWEYPSSLLRLQVSHLRFTSSPPGPKCGCESGRPTPHQWEDCSCCCYCCVWIWRWRTQWTGLPCWCDQGKLPDRDIPKNEELDQDLSEEAYYWETMTGFRSFMGRQRETATWTISELGWSKIPSLPCKMLHMYSLFPVQLLVKAEEEVSRNKERHPDSISQKNLAATTPNASAAKSSH